MTTKPSTVSLVPPFNPHLSGHIGIEQEFFLIRDDIPSPESGAFLGAIYEQAWKEFEGQCDWYYLAHAHGAEKMVAAWTYEFSACQVEVRTQPHDTLRKISWDLRDCETQGKRAAQAIGVDLARLEVAPVNMSMTHARDDRYERLSKIIPPEVRLAAFRVAGTHFHLGMSCLEEAVEMHDALCALLPKLIAMSDHSDGDRLRLYHQVVAWAMPEAHVPTVGTSPIYGSTQGWLNYLQTTNVTELRSCWDLVRITPHGTVELRALGIGKHIEEILSWVESVHTLLGRKIG